MSRERAKARRGAARAASRAAWATRRRGNRRARGFSLIELLVAVAIFTLLAAIAVPTYQEQVRSGRRAEARSMLLEAANRLERFNADNDGFTADMTAIGYAADPAPTPGGWYRVSAVANATTYTLTAVPQGDQAKDARCGSLTLSSAGVRGQTGPGPCW